MKKFTLYTLKVLAWFTGIITVVIAATFIYISYNKKEIIEKVRKQVAGKLNGEVQITNIDLSFTNSFPNVSVLLQGVSIKDTMFSRHQHPFFSADKVYGIIGIGNVLQKNNPLTGISIENGQLYVYTDTSGYTNAYLFSPKKSSDSALQKPSAKTFIESIKLKNVRLVMDNRLRNKLFDIEVRKVSYKIATTDSLFTFKTKNDLFIHSIAFNSEVGSYAKETSFEGDFGFTYHRGLKQLSFRDIEIALNRQSFKLSGLFSFAESATFALQVFSKKIPYSLAKGLMTAKIATALSLANISKPVDEVYADISGPLNGGEPLVKANWKISHADVQSKFLNLADCSMEGSYINEVVAGLPRYDPNSRLQFKNLTGVYEGILITTQNAIVDNLLLPVLTCDVKAAFELSVLNDLLASNTIKMNGGKGSLSITYSGPVQDNTSQNTLLNGNIALSDGTLQYLPRNITAKNVNGNILFKNSDVFVTDFNGNVFGNKIKMTGNGKNLLALIKTNPGRMFLEWNIYSPTLNLNNFASLLKKKTAVSFANNKKTKLGSTAKQLDEIVDYSNFIIKLKADKLLYSKFKATEVKAIMSLKDENWTLNKVNLLHAGGQMSVSGTLNEKNNNQYEAALKVNMENVDVNEVMYAFNNFGQKGIEADNLKGKLTSDAAIKFAIDRNTEQPSDISGYVDFSIKNGALLHYEPLKKVQTIIFKKRNFEEIYFAELKDRIDIKDKEITINRMEIQSTALTLFAEGLYSLKGNSDISIQVPISNLKKRDENYTPENKGVDSRGGASIFLRGRPGADGSIAFKLDVFKKLRKKKG